jgi:diaminobutyrate-2-oxoglutarate transaminase
VELFEELESNVRGYCRMWPTVFERAQGWTLVDEAGKEYLDFFAGAGALNYGHNHPELTARLTDFIAGEGVLHGLDMATTTKREFLSRFDEIVLRPRNLDYKLQFPGPTGTNAVEAALKLARKVTGRDRIVSFTNAFHGMTLGSLSVTGNAMKRRGAGIPLTFGDSMPFEGFFGDDVDTIEYFDRFLQESGSGVDLPAAVILETVQAEGGINVASGPWLRALADLCTTHNIILIVDDIQVGCGRTGPFFSWEEAGVVPDIVCLSKSLSGTGLPLALTLMKPEHDAWEPGEHNGTFRGNNAAFATASAALERFWSDDALTCAVDERSAQLRAGLAALATEHDGLFDEVRGCGLIQGLHSVVPEVASEVSAAAFERGMIIETAGADDDVVKLAPPLIVDRQAVDDALAVLSDAIDAVVEQLGDDLVSQGAALQATAAEGRLAP